MGVLDGTAEARGADEAYSVAKITDSTKQHSLPRSKIFKHYFSST